MNATDLLIARQVAENYLSMSRALEAEATHPEYRNMPLTIREIRQMAFLARNAQRAEYLDLPPLPVACKVCRQPEVCDWAAHGARQ